MIPAEVVGTADPIHPRCQHRSAGPIDDLPEMQVRNYIWAHSHFPGHAVTSERWEMADPTMLQRGGYALE
jgi:hypothetical protein